MFLFLTGFVLSCTSDNKVYTLYNTDRWYFDVSLLFVIHHLLNERHTQWVRGPSHHTATHAFSSCTYRISFNVIFVCRFFSSCSNTSLINDSMRTCSDIPYSLGDTIYVLLLYFTKEETVKECYIIVRCILETFSVTTRSWKCKLNFKWPTYCPSECDGLWYDNSLQTMWPIR